MKGLKFVQPNNIELNAYYDTHHHTCLDSSAIELVARGSSLHGGWSIKYSDWLLERLPDGTVLRGWTKTLDGAKDEIKRAILLVINEE